MVKSSYRFDGTSFTGAKYTYVGPASAPCRKTTGPSSVEMISNTNWELSGSSYLYGANVGLFGGGYDLGISNVVDTINISTVGNASNFGTLVHKRNGLAACSSRIYGYFAGGLYTYEGSSVLSNIIDYITFSSGGSAINYGDLYTERLLLAGCSSSTRGLFAGGRIDPMTSPAYTSLIDYIELTTSGNANSFGNISSVICSLSACASPIRGIFAGGTNGPGNHSAIIDYVTISTTGSTAVFGNLSQARSALTACSNSIKGVFAGGETGVATKVSTIDTITIMSSGTASDFGDLSEARYSLSSCSSTTRGVFGGGIVAGGNTNLMDYIEISTGGTAENFGNLTSARYLLAACSSGQGGF